MLTAVHYGPFCIKPWHVSGYVDPLAKASKSYRSREPRSVWQALVIDGKVEPDEPFELSVCPKCFLYSSNQKEVETHLLHCRFKERLPGALVYESEKYTIQAFDGGASEDEKLFVQSLCLFGKLFIETKSICFAVADFELFTVYDRETGLAAGFFSREKHPWFNYNLACIIVFPPFQRRGLGHLLIGFSYYLSRQEKRTGSPERPLSEHGRKAYLAYWCNALGEALKHEMSLSLQELGLATGIEPHDAVIALEHMHAITKNGRQPVIDLDQVWRYLDKHAIPVFNEKGVRLK